MDLLFGTAGVPRSSQASDTLSGMERIKELGLGFMELEFVQGVRMGKETAQKVALKRAELGIELTVHGPYFINLNAKEEAKIEASKKRIYDSAYIGALCGAQSVTFHAGFYLGDSPKQAYSKIKKNLADVVKQLWKDKINIRLSPELTGKPSQFGSLEELLELSREIEGISPCIDFSHHHARSGGANNTYQEFASALDKVQKMLGSSALKQMHFHTSGIKYSAKGELKHLDLPDSDMNYKDLLKALKDYQAGGFLVCESPNLETDALLMRDFYNSL
ncbi:MAG: TIM barrel protein [Candidatus Brocadiia bacterium]